MLRSLDRLRVSQGDLTTWLPGREICSKRKCFMTFFFLFLICLVTYLDKITKGHLSVEYFNGNVGETY